MDSAGKTSDCRTVTILGRRWRLEFCAVPCGIDGDCSPPDQSSKRIRIRRSLRGVRKLEVLIHEVLHAADWHKSEEWVRDVAEDLARIIHKSGYREASDGSD